MCGRAVDPLEELLRRADAAAGPPELPGDLPGRVRRLALRRRRARLAAAGIAAAVVIAVALGVVLHDLRTAPPAKVGPTVAATQQDKGGVEGADVAAELARLDSEARSRLAVVAHMLACEARHKRLAELRRELAKPGVAEQIQRQVDDAAFVLIYFADRQLRQEHGRQAAVANYQQVIQLFGQTRWAEVARRRLREIQET